MRFSLVRINIITYLLYFLSIGIARTFVNSPARYAESFFTLVVVLVLGGLNITALLQVILKKRFSRLEFINIAAAASFVLIPLINLTEISFLGQFNQNVVLFNSVFFYLLALLTHWISPSGHKIFFHNPSFVINRGDVKKLSFPILIVAIYAIVVGIIITAYYALTDLDPYYWMPRTQACIAGGVVSSCFNQRPLFEMLNLVFTYTAKIDIYAYYKYVLPLLSLMIVLPALLVVNTTKTFSGKLILALSPLAVPSTLLYLLTPIPQTIAIILSFYFLYWILYSCFSEGEYFYYLAGVISFFIFWYHEVGVAFFVIWFIVAIFKDGKKYFCFLRRNKFVGFFLLLFLLSNLPLLKTPYNFVSFWATNFASLGQVKTNFYFPATYVNIDGNSMGWSGSLGVMKYYAFYVGPLVITLLFFSLLRIFQSRTKNNQENKDKIFSKQYVTLFLLFATFFSIAEVFPRLFSYAFLPERIWIFAGITAFFLLVFFRADWEKTAVIRYIFLASIVVGIMGAIYINQQKRFFLPQYRLNAAEWIKENLPSNRIILSVSDNNLISFYAQSRYYTMPDSFYCDERVSNATDVWEYFKRGNVRYSPKQESIEKSFRDELAEYLGKQVVPTISSVRAIVEKYTILIDSKGKQLEQKDLLSSGYIYFFREDPRNPYAERPYYKKAVSCDVAVFERHPESFSLVYNDNGMVEIWKIIK